VPLVCYHLECLEIQIAYIGFLFQFLSLTAIVRSLRRWLVVKNYRGILSGHYWCEEMCILYFIHIVILISFILIYNFTTMNCNNSCLPFVLYSWSEVLTFPNRKCLSFC
jgi:hypothetical protein